MNAATRILVKLLSRLGLVAIAALATYFVIYLLACGSLTTMRKVNEHARKQGFANIY